MSEKFTEAQLNLIDILFDLSVQMNNATDYDSVDKDIETVDKISAIIKRRGDTILVDNRGESGGVIE